MAGDDGGVEVRTDRSVGDVTERFCRVDKLSAWDSPCVRGAYTYTSLKICIEVCSYCAVLNTAQQGSSMFYTLRRIAHNTQFSLPKGCTVFISIVLCCCVFRPYYFSRLQKAAVFIDVCSVWQFAMDDFQAINK